MIDLRIVEVAYDVSPGGERSFEVYSAHEDDIYEPPMFSTEDLHKAVDYCYELDLDFEIKTFAAWSKDETEVLQGKRGSKVDTYGQLMLPL
jgi:hypothetical protein